jgi:hypothetical protein
MENVDWIQTFVLTLTLLVLYFYTAETAALRRETVRQTRIILRPVVIPIFELFSPGNWIFKLKNIGSGSAFNIIIKPLTQNYGIGQITYIFRPIDFLAPQDSKIISLNQFLGGVPHTSSLTDQAFYPIFATSEHKLTILFDDVEGKCYSLSALVIPSAHPGFVEGEIKLGPIGDVKVHERTCIKKIIDRIFQWYP